MTDQFKVDIDELLAVAEETIGFLKSQKWSKSKPLEILEKLISESRERIDAGLALDQCQFDSSTVAEWFDRSRAKKDENRKWLKGHLDSYEEFIDENREALAAYLIEKGHKARLSIDNTGSQGGEKNYFYIALQPIEPEGSGETTAQESIPPGSIQYQLRQLPKLNPLAKSFSQFDLEGYKLWLYAAPIALIGFAGLFLWFDILVFRNINRWPLVILLVGLVWLFWSLFGAFYSLLDRRISIAPDWMVPWKCRSSQLEMIPTKKQKLNGYPVRVIRLVRYGADCGICGAPIEVVRGKREFAGRLIGQCNENGVEHIYSFDQVSKVGLPLRKNAYYRRSNKQLDEFYNSQEE